MATNDPRSFDTFRRAIFRRRRGGFASGPNREFRAGREVFVSTPCRGQTWQVHVVAS